jgi:hypothetical protein
MLRHILDTLGGFCQLARLAVMTRCRFKGPYWQWRLDTAYGRNRPASRLAMLREVLEHARWIHRSRRCM